MYRLNKKIYAKTFTASKDAILLTAVRQVLVEKGCNVRHMLKA